MKVFAPLFMISGMCGCLWIIAIGLDQHLIRTTILGVWFLSFYTFGLYKTLPAKL